jgi:hypothetical protein
MYLQLSDHLVQIHRCLPPFGQRLTDFVESPYVRFGDSSGSYGDRLSLSLLKLPGGDLGDDEAPSSDQGPPEGYIGA